MMRAAGQEMSRNSIPLDLTFNIIQTEPGRKPSSASLITDEKEEKDSRFDQYELWNRSGWINTSCQRELFMHVMNISASLGREEEEGDEEEEEEEDRCLSSSRLD
ncbi:Hypothetical predicted protein [Scomber scombrus]|uniref:Uncharacterized protein n=1 Tax=Scomber scombrus TaxID=13677 RepID=A0AAV1PSI8_SCOSC